MDSVVPKPMHHGRRLFELLEEEQEPFLLDVYLLEQSYSDHRAVNANAAFVCSPVAACKRLKRFITAAHGFKRKRGGGLVKFLFSKVVFNKVTSKAWSVAIDSGRWMLLGSFFEVKGKVNSVEFRRLSNSGRTDGGEADKEKWRDLSSSNQLSPVSVLDQHSDEVEEESPSPTRFVSAKEAPWVDLEQLLYSNSLDLKKAGTKSHFLQPQRFVLDWLRELEGSIPTSRECWSPLKSQNVIASCKNPTVDMDSISQLIDADLSMSSKEWSQFQREKREIGTEIEHIIFEEIRKETVLAILSSHSPCTLRRCLF